MSTTATDDTAVVSPDSILAEAVDLARSAVAAEARADQIGDHLGCFGLTDPADAEQAPVAVHLFGCTSLAYVGWCWAVSVTRAPDNDVVTVDEVMLQPGEGALLPPPWVPWAQRLRPGDLGAGDLLPTAPDDQRLVPSYTASGDPALDEPARELGLGRVRVMSREGRLEAAQRWYEGRNGPDSPIAKQAPGPCGTCGFYLPLAGSLQAMVGVCGNEYSPSDGQAVVVEHGCGAHSEAVPEPLPEPLTAVSYDTMSLDTERPFDTERYDVLDAEIEPVALPEVEG